MMSAGHNHVMFKSEVFQSDEFTRFQRALAAHCAAARPSSDQMVLQAMPGVSVRLDNLHSSLSAARHELKTELKDTALALEAKLKSELERSMVHVAHAVNQSFHQSLVGLCQQVVNMPVPASEMPPIDFNSGLLTPGTNGSSTPPEESQDENGSYLGWGMAAPENRTVQSLWDEWYGLGSYSALADPTRFHQDGVEGLSKIKAWKSKLSPSQAKNLSRLRCAVRAIKQLMASKGWATPTPAIAHFEGQVRGKATVSTIAEAISKASSKVASD